MQIKTKIMSKLTDNFYRLLYALSCSFILWIAYAFRNHSQLPRMGKTWSVDLFPVKSKYYPSPPCFFCPNRIQEATTEVWLLDSSMSVWTYTLLSLRFLLGGLTLAVTCRLAKRFLLMWALLFFPSFWLPLTPFRPLLGHVAFLITTIMGCLSFPCHPHGCYHQSVMTVLQHWASSPKGWPHSFSFPKVSAALLSVPKRVALLFQVLLGSSLEDQISFIYCQVTNHPQNWKLKTKMIKYPTLL